MSDIKYGTPVLDDLTSDEREKALETLFEDAISSSDSTLDSISYYIKKGASPNLEWDGHTLLCAVAIGGNQEAVDLLLYYGADVNVLGGHGMSPMAVALQAGQPEIAIKLFEAGADPALGTPSAKDLGFSVPN